MAIELVRNMVENVVEQAGIRLTQKGGFSYLEATGFEIRRKIKDVGDLVVTALGLMKVVCSTCQIAQQCPRAAIKDSRREQPFYWYVPAGEEAHHRVNLKSPPIINQGLAELITAKGSCQIR